MTNFEEKVSFHWYQVIKPGEVLQQGDFFNKCPVVTPTTTTDIKPGKTEAEVLEYDVVVMSQSCDLEYEKIDLVLVCPVWQLKEFEQKHTTFKNTKEKEKLRKGNHIGYHLLNECKLEGFEKDFLIVDFRHVYGVPYKFLQNLSKNKPRLRLLPPYREHLSQAFARFFMRVGLPTDIPPFT